MVGESDAVVQVPEPYYAAGSQEKMRFPRFCGEEDESGYVPVIENCLRQSSLSGEIIDGGEAGSPQDLHDVGVSAQLVAFSLARCQVAADETEAGLMQRHADGDGALERRRKLVEHGEKRRLPFRRCNMVVVKGD